MKLILETKTKIVIAAVILASILAVGVYRRTLFPTIFPRKSYEGLENFRWLGDTGLALSGLPENSHWDTLKSYGINATINVIEGVEDNVTYLDSIGISYYHLPSADGDWTPTFEETQNAINWINMQLTDNRKVLIHCGWGMGRAPTMACMWYIEQGHTPEEARKWIDYQSTYITDKQIEAIYSFYDWIRD